jgi:hypothetical protein
MVQPPGRYLDVEMPKRFALQLQGSDGAWLDDAVCLQREFERLPDGSYICSAFGSATWIRCVGHREDGFDHVDGGGQLSRYRLVELPEPPI